MSASGACPACGGALQAWRAARPADPVLGRQLIPLWRCARCGTAVTGGTAPAGMYETGAYGPGSPRLHALARPLLAAFDRRRLSLIRALVPPPARLLDVGAGRGRFLAAARAAGYDASGIEPSARAADSQAPLSRAGIEDADIPAGSLDVITMWHVLEHLPDPGGALRRAGHWLRPDGALLVGVPNLSSLQALLGGGCWFHLDVPRHRTHFTPRGLDLLLRAHGFAVVRTHHVLAEHNPFGMWQSLLSHLTRHPAYVYNLLKRNAPLASPDLALAVCALPLLPVAALVELAAGAAGRGGTIAVLAQRQGAALA